MKISVIIPTIGNGKIGSILGNYFEADEVLVLYNKGRQCVDNMNDLGKRATGDIIVQVNDRCVIKPGWRKEVEKQFNIIKSGVVSFAPGCVTNGAISRDYMGRYQLGCVFFPEYIHHYADKEMAEKSRSLGLYAEIKNFIEIIPKERKVIDEARVLNQYAWDFNTYKRRKKLGFPNHLTAEIEERNQYIYVH